MKTKFTMFQTVLTATGDTVKVEIDSESLGDSPSALFMRRAQALKKQGFKVTVTKTVSSRVTIAG